MSRRKLLTSAAQPAPPLGKMHTEDEMRVYIRERYRINATKRTVEDWRLSGEGPPFRRSGRTPLYEEHDIDAWALRRLSRAHRCTAEEQAPSPDATPAPQRAPVKRRVRSAPEPIAS